MKRSFLPLALLLLLAPGRASAASPVAFVYEYNGPETAYRVVHDRVQEKLSTFLMLYPGDRVDIVVTENALKTNSRNYIALDLGGRPVKIEAGDPPYCVGATSGDCNKMVDAMASEKGVPPTLLANLLAGLHAFFGIAHQDYYAEQTESMLPRGVGAQTIRIPLLASPAQRIGAGERALALEWRGGTPPFDVALYRDDASKPLATLRTPSTRAAFSPLVLRKGSYHFQIVDADRDSSAATFAVVATGDVPQPTADEHAALDDPALSPEVRTTLGAALLAKDDATWNLEAYERVAPIAGTCPPAELLRYRLAEGED